MIYLKKQDNSIVELENNRFHLIQLDKQMRSMEAIKDEEKIKKRKLTNEEKKEIIKREHDKIGKVYDENSLPDEDKLSLGFITQNEYDKIQSDKAIAKQEAERERLIQEEMRRLAERSLGG